VDRRSPPSAEVGAPAGIGGSRACWDQTPQCHEDVAPRCTPTVETLRRRDHRGEPEAATEAPKKSCSAPSEAVTFACWTRFPEFTNTLRPGLRVLSGRLPQPWSWRPPRGTKWSYAAPSEAVTCLLRPDAAGPDEHVRGTRLQACWAPTMTVEPDTRQPSRTRRWSRRRMCELLLLRPDTVRANEHVHALDSSSRRGEAHQPPRWSRRSRRGAEVVAWCRRKQRAQLLRPARRSGASARDAPTATCKPLGLASVTRDAVPSGPGGQRRPAAS